MAPLKLEVFHVEAAAGETEAEGTGPDLDEEARLAAYEKGYAAGWDDALASQAEDQQRIRTELARHLQAISFTFHEARSHMLRSVGPVLVEMAARILPRMARQTIGATVLETLMPELEQASKTPITILVNPAERATVEAVFTSVAGLPVELRDEPSLGESQVFILRGETETRIDLDRAIAEIEAALRAYLEMAEQEVLHG
jgi:flagellar assembly protein FliH